METHQRRSTSAGDWHEADERGGVGASGWEGKGEVVKYMPVLTIFPGLIHLSKST